METKIKMELTQVKSKMLESGMDKQAISRECSFALQAYNSNDQLKKCSLTSFQAAIVNIANIGLSLNPAKKEAYLIPRYVRANNGYDAVLEPSYIGLIKLACQGDVKNIITNLVYENDGFEIDIASNTNPIKHSPEMGDRGNPKGVYAIAYFADGTAQSEWMNIETVYQIRDNSDGYKAFVSGKVKQCTWDLWFPEMARKAVVKRLCKYLPGASEKLSEAIRLDNEDYGASLQQLSFIESLLSDAQIPENEIDGINDELFGNMSFVRAKYLISYLKDNQPENLIRYNGGTSNQAQLDKSIQNAIDRDE